MNSTFPENQTSFFDVTCLSSKRAFLIQLLLAVLDLFVFLPIQLRVLWLGLINFRIKGRLETSEIFTMNLAAVEVFVIMLYVASMAAYILHYHLAVLLFMFFYASYLVGRPVMNSWICIERYIAVARPVMYRNPSYVKHRYIISGLVWMAVMIYGGNAVSTYPHLYMEVYIVALLISILVIAACSLGMLKILLKPGPGEAHIEGMHRQKKRAFIIITVILVCISVPYILDVLLFLRKKNISLDVFCLLVSIDFWMMRPSSVIQSVLYLSKKRKLPCGRKKNP